MSKHVPCQTSISQELNALWRLAVTRHTFCMSGVEKEHSFFLKLLQCNDIVNPYCPYLKLICIRSGNFMKFFYKYEIRMFFCAYFGLGFWAGSYLYRYWYYQIADIFCTKYDWFSLNVFGFSFKHIPSCCSVWFISVCSALSYCNYCT